LNGTSSRDILNTAVPANCFKASLDETIVGLDGLHITQQRSVTTHTSLLSFADTLLFAIDVH
jgi:hypothetical protein